MNQITSFRLCTISNEELLNKVDKAVDEIYQTGKIPGRHIPARPNDDFDLLVGELLVRFKELQSDLNHNIQRCLEIAEERDKALAGTERVECYLPVSVNDRSEPMPKDGNCYLLFDNGEIRHFFQDDLPFNSVTHWLKKTTLTVVNPSKQS